MQKVINFTKKNIFILFVVVVSIPTFWRMLPFGIYSMQDFHLFRLFEFDKCVKLFQIPCRWSPDAGLGYGEPLFNFYGQFSYIPGEISHLIGLSFIDSLKTVFIISLLGSMIAMFFLAKKIYNNNYAAFISSVIYIYAPYRAVDVWVRGALPEAFSFVLFPLILLSIEYKNSFWFSLLLATLTICHNLSVVMFLPILIVWIVYRRFWKAIPAGIFAAMLSAFYILPVIFESKFINIGSTIGGYFDFRAHFVTISQLLISRFWGYGGSTWGAADGLSLSVGQIQWILPILIFVILVFKNKIKSHKEFIIFFILGWFFLFLTHNKSTFIWTSLPFMAYIQFPWRFLGMATLCFAIASGAIFSLINKQKVLICLIIVIFAVGLSYSFFREDIWYKVSDMYFTTGAEWDRQRTASIGDFWPDLGHTIPDKPATGEFINYFPGWVGALPVNGLIPAKGTRFTDTPIRSLGNIISLISLLFITVLLIKQKFVKEKLVKQND